MELPFYMQRNEMHESNRMKESAKQLREFSSQVSIPDHHMMSFDALLNDIGFGRYQVYVYLIMALMSISEGAQVTIFTLMIPILKQEWEISDSLNSLQASFVFIGFLTGSMLSGQIADRVGRKKPFLISSLFTTIISFATISCQEIYSLLFLRGVMGILVGLFAPCGVTMLSEITPIALRGRYMGLITLTFAVGQLYGLLIAAFTLETLDRGNWRALTFWCTIPGMCAFILSLFKLEESARFALLSGDSGLGFEVVQNMSNSNNSDLIVNEELRIKLVNWVHSMNRIAKNQENASVFSLFENNRCMMTVLIWFNWFILSFVYYGIVLLLPNILTHLRTSAIGKDKILQLVISCVSDIFGAMAAAFFIEMKGFGRKNSLIIFFMVQAITSLFAYVDIEERFTVWSTLSKFFLSMTFIFSYQYTAEVYPTKIRTTGIGMANGLGRMGGVIMPWVTMYLTQIDVRLPFVLFAILSVITSGTNCLLPYDTMGKELEG